MSTTPTPMMAQWHAAKAEHREGVLFFRMGDFYEFFHDDARKAARLLGLALTSRAKGDAAIPMAGVPVRSLDQNVRKLVQAGEKVVICDQVEDPESADGLVERKVTRIVTPGTITEEDSLDSRANNYLAAFIISRESAGLAWADVSTGEFCTRRVESERILEELQMLEPAEILVSENEWNDPRTRAELESKLQVTWTPRSAFAFDTVSGTRRLKERLGVFSLEAFGIDENSFPVGAAAALLDYVEETQRGALGQFRRLRVSETAETMFLDRSTRAALELVQTQRNGERHGSLLSVLDHTLTPMGARRLRQWLLAPLIRAEAIKERLDALAELALDRQKLEVIRDVLRPVLDLERLAGRLGSGRAGPRDLVALRQSLRQIPELVSSISALHSSRLVKLRNSFPNLDSLQDLLERSLGDDVPLALKEGGIIRAGFNAELDELRSLGTEGRNFIAEFQARESAATGIPLKVGYNRVFGFYIEITNTYRDLLPPRYVRKQTLKNAERYITDELKTYEDKVLNADERKNVLEFELFQEIREQAEAQIAAIQTSADLIADLDALHSLAECSLRENFIRPERSPDGVFLIEEGRHPVLSRAGLGTTFVPNDVDLDAHRRVMVITGPNMAGKSTYIRQTALFALLHQIGSFVPARRALLPVFDRVYTRVGAHDDISRGASTFMVEMLEVANILNNAGPDSLVILDEVGRGTSTYDGLSLAWAVTRHLALVLRSKTLFATHYHELCELENEVPAVRNYNVAVREWDDQIIFLHKIVAGGTDRSYGIHVARLAGIPGVVIDQAKRVLHELEQRPRSSEPVVHGAAAEVQLDLFGDPARRIRDDLLALVLDDMSPREAHARLVALQDAARDSLA